MVSATQAGLSLSSISMVTRMVACTAPSRVSSALTSSPPARTREPTLTGARNLTLSVPQFTPMATLLTVMTCGSIMLMSDSVR